MILELRENPVYAAQLLLNRDYDPQQALAIWGMWTHPYSMLDWGRGVGKCVSGSTKIRLADDSLVTIKELYDKQSTCLAYEPNEWWAVMDEPLFVRAYDIKKKKLVNRQVLTILKQKVTENFIKITMDNDEEIVCTKIHKFLELETMDWIEAKKLRVGSQLVSLNEDNKLAVYGVRSWEVIKSSKEEFMYDLMVVGLKNYIANGFITHNTTMASDVEVLSGLLYPGSVSMVVSHSMKGAKLVFDELIKTWMRSPVVQEATPKRPTKGNDLCEMPFNSINKSTGQQTLIKGVAADINGDGASIRGNRVSRCLHIDEWIFLPQSLIDGAVIPCASNQIEAATPEYDLNLTRFIFTSSSGYTYMEAYKRMETFRKFFLDPEKYAEYAIDEKTGKPKYFYHNLNYTKITKNGILNQDNIKMWKATFTFSKFNTEVLAHWESESGSWYNSVDIKGDPEDPKKEKRGIWISTREDFDAKIEQPRDNNGKLVKDDRYAYVIGIDPAEQQDETGVALIRVTPDRLYIADTQGYENTTMPEVAEIIRMYMDQYNIVSIALDPEGGGRAGVIPELKTTKVRHNTLTGKLEPFFPVYPIHGAKELKKTESIPPGARQIIKCYTFSSNANEANLTDLNSTLRTIIKSRGLVVAEDGSVDFRERVEKLMDQIIAIEATPISTNKNKEAAKQAADKGRYSFTSRVRKDRWAALLIAVWEAIMIQAEMNMPEEDEDPGIIIIPSIYGDNFGGYY